MTQFRTKGKGKDKKTYPVGQPAKRVPYGISKDLAKQKVETLRYDGEKARLVETNRKHDLYAPYTSALNEIGIYGLEDIPKEYHSIIPKSDTFIVGPMEKLSKKFHMGKPVVFKDENGSMSTVAMMDNDGYNIIWETMPENFSMEQMEAYNKGKAKFYLPDLKFGKDDSDNITLKNHEAAVAKSTIKSLINEVGRNSKSNYPQLTPYSFHVAFYKPQHSKTGYMVILPYLDTIKDNKLYGKAIPVKMDGATDTLSMYNAVNFLNGLEMYNEVFKEEGWTVPRTHYGILAKPGSDMVVAMDFKDVFPVDHIFTIPRSSGVLVPNSNEGKDKRYLEDVKAIIKNTNGE